MESYTLKATRRTELGKQLDPLRRANNVPAVVYGHGLPNVNLTVNGQELLKIFRQTGGTGLVDLVIDQAAPVKVLIHDLQQHPTKSKIIHADFYQVRMTEKLEADIQIELVGESPAVKELGGVLVRSLDKVKVECLPGDLVAAIEVDISRLKTFEDRIHVSDITAPKGITIVENPEEVVASVTPPRSEAELEALSAKVEEDVTAVGTVEKEKKADEESEAEGESKPEPKTESTK